MSDKNKESPEGRRTGETRQKLTSLLTSWYGEQENSCVLLHHLPKTKTIGEVMDSLGELLYPKNAYILTRIQEAWTEIAGLSVAKITKPIFFQEKILNVEVAHPAYLMALNSKRARAAMIMKINKVLGQKVCDEIRFVPLGRRSNLGGKGICQ